MKNIMIIKRLLKIVSKFKYFISLAVLNGIIGNALSIMISALAGLALIKYFGINLYLSYGWIFALIIISGVLRGVLRYFEQYSNHYIAFNLLAHIRHIIFEKLRELSPAKLLTKEKGNLTSQITSDVETLEVFYAHTISPILIAFFVNGAIVVLLSIFIHPFIGLIALTSYILIGVIIPLIFYFKSRSDGYDYRKELSSFSGMFLDSIKGKNDILFNNQKDNYLKIITYRTCSLQRYKEKNLMRLENVRLIVSGLIFFGGIAMIITSYLLSKYTGFNFINVVLVLCVYLASFGPIVSLSSLPSNLNQTFASAKRLFDLLDEKPLVEISKNKSSFVFSNLEVANLSFGYNELPILNNFNFSIKRGEIVGIVAQSGKGKSTLLNLLMHFYPYKGSIKYNGIELTDISNDDLYSNVTMFSQSTYLFCDTVINNIRVAKSDATKEEVIEALKKASCYEFVESLENGLDTVIKENSSNISLGQKQRLGLARVFLREPKLLLLDEPTSNIDIVNEKMILESITKYRSNMSIVIVSHKKSSLSIADRIIQIGD